MILLLLGLLFLTSIVTLLYLLLDTSFAHAMVVATTHLIGHVESFLANATGCALIDRATIDVTEFVRTVFTEDDVDAVQQMGGRSTECLKVMFSQIDHLGVVDGGDLRVP